MSKRNKIIEYAMNMEKRSMEFYQMYKEKVSNKETKDLFERLEKMEEEHYHLLKRSLESLEANKSLDDINLDLGDGEEILEKGSEGLKGFNLEQSMTDLPILRMAYQMESDFAKYYKVASEKESDPEAKRILLSLSKWEDTHEELFAGLVENSMKALWADQGFAPF